MRAFLDLLHYRIEPRHEADDDPPCCLQAFDVFARDLLQVATEEQDGIQLVGINPEADAEVFDEISMSCRSWCSRCRRVGAASLN